MLNKLLPFIRQYQMIKPGDTVVCAVSGGADSVALLWAMYLLRDKLQINVEAAHFNHNLRGEESDRDARFVKDLCDRYDIPLHVGSGTVIADKKGLEAAARKARYAFFSELSGKIATAHTADDNAETVLMHMIRGAGLKGLCGIMPICDRLIRPMLSVTRADVVAFLDAYHMPFVEDSSNGTDQFFRNRLRHHVMPCLHEENPRFAQAVSEMAMRLREDENYLDIQAKRGKTTDVASLRKLDIPIQKRVLRMLLEDFGVLEPSAEHIALLFDVLHGQNPSAKGDFPGNIQIGQVDGKLEKLTTIAEISIPFAVSDSIELPDLNLRISCSERPDENGFSFMPSGNMIIRSRIAGDSMRLPGGTKSLKKLFIDKKIPAAYRNRIPIVADDSGVIAVYGFGGNLDRQTKQAGSVYITFETVNTIPEEK